MLMCTLFEGGGGLRKYVLYTHLNVGPNMKTFLLNLGTIQKILLAGWRLFDFHLQIHVSCHIMSHLIWFCMIFISSFCYFFDIIRPHWVNFFFITDRTHIPKIQRRDSPPPHPPPRLWSNLSCSLPQFLPLSNIVVEIDKLQAKLIKSALGFTKYNRTTPAKCYVNKIANLLIY